VNQGSTSPEVWNISESEFPRYSSIYDKLKFFLRYAILAPSIHNTQPWSFRIQNNNTIELYADRKRALSVLDPVGRELTISCGIVLGYLQITISHFGYQYETEVPSSYDMEKSDNQPLAKISIYDENGSNNTCVNSLQKEDNDRLFGAIPKRRTSRFGFIFEDRAIPDILRAGFYYIVDKYPHCQQHQKNEQQEPIWLHITEAINEKETIAGLVAYGDDHLLSDQQFVNELTQWAHLNKYCISRNRKSRYRSGIASLISKINPQTTKSIQFNKKREDKVRELAATSPILVILGSPLDRPLDWISTGMALTNILLLASSENVCCSFLNQPIHVPQLRLKLLDAIGKEKGFPQILLGLGYSSLDIRPSPKRDVEEILVT
jgi:hypothetical protein